jgi:hypothetical protein
MYAHDLEDLVAIIDGRAELLQELEASPLDMVQYLACGMRDLIDDPLFVEALPGHLPGDSASQARLGLVERRVRAIAALAISAS